MRILCVIPALPEEIKIETLRSVWSQTVPVTSMLLLTKLSPKPLPFPAKISYVLNGMLDYVNIEYFDYLLRVDADTVLPPNFVEEHIKQDFKAVGCGYAQLVDVPSFIKYCCAKFHPDHDDGYIIEKLAAAGLKSSWRYAVAPTVNRQPGFHRGGEWYRAQGELKYRYGWEPLGFGVYLLMHWCAYSLYEAWGFIQALLRGKQRFDVGELLLYRRLQVYREPSRFFKLPKFALKVWRGNIE